MSCLKYFVTFSNRGTFMCVGTYHSETPSNKVNILLVFKVIHNSIPDNSK